MTTDSNNGTTSSGEDLSGLAAGLVIAGLVGAGLSARKLFGQRKDKDQVKHRVDAQRLALEGNGYRNVGNLQQALRSWQAALQLDAASVLARNGVAWAAAVQANSPVQLLHQALGYVELALKSATMPLEKAECLNTRAEIQLRRGDFPAAVADSQACLAGGGAQVSWLAINAWRRLGIAQGYLGQIPLAYQALRTATALDPTNLDTRVSLARLANSAADHETAITEYQACVVIVSAAPNRTPEVAFLLSTLLNELGCALTAGGRQGEADHVFSEAIKAFSGNPYPFLNAAFSASRRGDRAQMQQLITAALTKADPADTHMTYTLINESSIDANGDVVLDALLAFRRIEQQEYLRRRDLVGHRAQMRREPVLINSQDQGIGAAVTKIRVLLLSANPFGTPRLSIEEELRRIEVRVTLSKQRHLLDLTAHGAVRPEELLRYLDESLPHIVHFSGHGSAEGEIILAADDGGSTRVSPATLSRVFATMRNNIQVVVLNACWSSVQAKAIHEHIDWVVGMRRSINDEAAAEFAAAFYGALGFQRTVPEAFARGLLALELKGFADVDTPELLARPGAEERIRFGR